MGVIETSDRLSRNRHRAIISTIFGMGLLISSTNHSAFGAEVRPDPFQPMAAPEDVRKIEERTRVLDLIRSLLPEIRASLSSDIIAQARGTLIDEAKRAAIDAVKADPSLIPRNAGPGAVAAPPPAPVAAKLPEGAKFIACLNGKALYRDPKENMQFFREVPPGAPNRCGGGA